MMTLIRNDFLKTSKKFLILTLIFWFLSLPVAKADTSSFDVPAIHIRGKAGIPIMVGANVDNRNKVGANTGLYGGIDFPVSTKGFLGFELGGDYTFLKTTDANASLNVVCLSTNIEGGLQLSKWRLGSIFQFWFGTDVSLAENPQVYTDRKKGLAVWGGIEVIREISLFKSNFDIGTRLTTDLNLPSRQVLLPQVFLTYRIPISNPEKIDETEETSPGVSKTESSVGPANSNIISVAGDKTVLLNLDESVLKFEVNLAVLPDDKLELLRRIGKFLSQRSSDFTKIRIYGHADKTGNTLVNLRLSESRAQFVADQISTSGISRDRILDQGFGSSQPKNRNENATAFAENRRVEVFIDGLENPSQFVKEAENAIFGSPGF